MEVAGEAMHPGGVLDHPVKQVGQGECLTPHVSMDTDRCGANYDLYVQKHQKENSKP